MATASATASANGFAFERRIGHILNELKAAMAKADETTAMVVRDEQQIRDFFNEQSLNGVDHMIQVQISDGQHLFLLQEKWKLLTNQREVSQFLDCCARILARMPDYKGKIHRLWVSRTVPSINGDKSLQEGQTVVIQTCTSQTLLAMNTLLTICDLLEPEGATEYRQMALGIIGRLGSLLPNAEEAIADPKAANADPKPEEGTFEPVSNFGEKRVLPITKQTVVMVKKVN